MRVNVDDIAFMDPRFKKLGGRLGMSWFEALGRCLPVWTLAYVGRSPIVQPGDVDAVAERAGFADAMLVVDLAAAVSDGLWIRGVEARIDFLLIQDAKREKANAAKRSAMGITTACPPGPPRGLPRASPPGRPYSPALAPDLALAHALEEPPIPPLRGDSDSPPSRSSRRKSRASVVATPAEIASVRVILDRLSAVAGVAYRGCDDHTRLIVERLRDGITEHELRAVVAYCAEEWEQKPEMRRYLRPETLFGPRTISKYLDPARSHFSKELSELAKKEPPVQPKLELVS